MALIIRNIWLTAMFFLIQGIILKRTFRQNQRFWSFKEFEPNFNHQIFLDIRENFQIFLIKKISDRVFRKNPYCDPQFYSCNDFESSTTTSNKQATIDTSFKVIAGIKNLGSQYWFFRSWERGTRTQTVLHQLNLCSHPSIADTNRNGIIINQIVIVKNIHSQR